MSALSFPSDPSFGDEYQSWKWDGEKWAINLVLGDESMWRKFIDEPQEESFAMPDIAVNVFLS